MYLHCYRLIDDDVYLLFQLTKLYPVDIMKSVSYKTSSLIRASTNRFKLEKCQSVQYLYMNDI